MLQRLAACGTVLHTPLPNARAARARPPDGPAGRTRPSLLLECELVEQPALVVERLQVERAVVDGRVAEVVVGAELVFEKRRGRREVLELAAAAAALLPGPGDRRVHPFALRTAADRGEGGRPSSPRLGRGQRARKVGS